MKHEHWISLCRVVCRITLSSIAVVILTRTAAAQDRIGPGGRLYPNESITSGNTSLVYQGDNNLVLYQGGTAVWATMTSGGPGSFEMQGDCNAVVYGSGGPVWASGTNGQGSSCEARVTEGDWFICDGTNRVWSARGGGSCGGGGISDADGDGIDDGTELQIATALMPAILRHPDESCPNPVDPKPIAFRLRHPTCTSGATLTDWVAINYYVLYSEDCGCGGHSGDNEGIVVLGRLENGQWNRVFISTAAHVDTPAEKHSTCELCSAVLASEDKHGNYTNANACHEWWVCDEHCGWLPGVPYWDSTNTQLWNVGERSAHLIDNWTTIHPSFYGSVWSGKFMEAGQSNWDLRKFWLPQPPAGCSWNQWD